MKSLVIAKIVGFISLLMTYSPVSKAMTEHGVDHLCFGIGMFLGCVITLSLGLYLNRHYRIKYHKLLRQFKSAKSNARIAKQALNTLAKEQEDSQDLLEERIQERTLELSIALKELEIANQELEPKARGISYFFTRVDPCISMHRAEMSRAKCSERIATRAQRFK
jgi:hypothetical protein